MKENQKLLASLFGLFALISLACFFAAEGSGLWRELWITEIFLFVISIWVFFLLRAKPGNFPR